MSKGTLKRGASMLRQEIFSQPEVLSRILDRETTRVQEVAGRIAAWNPQVVLIVARGSADNAGLYGKYLFGALNRKVVALATPSLVTRYGALPDLSRALVLAISQSGESYDVVEVVEAARRAGAMTLALTNTRRSPLARAAELVLHCHAGRERSVAATKTYSAQLLLLAMLSAALEGSPRRGEAIRAVPQSVAAALQIEPAVIEAAERLRYLERCAVIGRGFCYGTAFEIALKLLELTHVVAQPYSAADFRHGPIAMVEPGFCVLMLAPRGRVLADARELLADLHERGAETIVISDARTVLQRATSSLVVPTMPEWLAPLTCVVPGQLLALHLCQSKGLPVDAPRGLAKVTRTR